MQTSRARRVFLLDSHDIFRMGVRSALSERNELTVVGEAGDLDVGLPLVARSRPHVVVVGIREHERALLDNLPRLRAQHPSAKTLVLSRTEDDQLVAAALRGGASGLLVKDIAVTQLVAAVHSVAGGHNLIDSVRAKRLAANRAPQPTHDSEDPLAVLTPQERKILDLIGQGMTNRQIAERLFLVEKTVRNHVTRMLAKLGVERRTQAALLAARLHHTRSTGSSRNPH
ncbi:response regulator transcription factor [Marmoricola sp. URHB0036]|uniref:LuxR C-terminal-related transcriptional regulator n=1 Tax=Marmoricola sp. URHB0036 TaxID=1298863 RepID=UPI00047F8728|nr:response regulator transcription factor [Marmoricola sp. URHB0036]